jgi:hypothetical protein
MYRPRLGHSPKLAEGRLGDGGEKNASAKNNAESSNDKSKRANALNSDPYEFSDGQDIKKELKVTHKFGYPYLKVSQGKNKNSICI